MRTALGNTVLLTILKGSDDAVLHLEESSLWTLSTAHWYRDLSMGPNTVGVAITLPEDGNRFSFRNVVFLETLYTYDSFSSSNYTTLTKNKCMAKWNWRCRKEPCHHLRYSPGIWLEELRRFDPETLQIRNGRANYLTRAFVVFTTWDRLRYKAMEDWTQTLMEMHSNCCHRPIISYP
jgi:hypothetical protein